MEEDLVKAYKVLKKKYNLPPLDELDNAFEVNTLDAEGFLLREIIRKISEQIDSYGKLLEEVLQPETHIGQMREANAFDEESKNKLYNLYKEIRFHYRKSHEALIEGTDKSCAEFINAYFKAVVVIREQMVGVMKELSQVWKIDRKVSEDLGYLG